MKRAVCLTLTLTALAPQLFRDWVGRSFCVTRFTDKRMPSVPQGPLSPRAAARHAGLDGRVAGGQT